MESNQVVNKQDKEEGRTNVLRKLDEKIPEPDKIIKWYINYLKSDFVQASFSVAILLTIQLYFGIEWTSLYEKLILFYVIYIGIMISKISKAVEKK